MPTKDEIRDAIYDWMEPVANTPAPATPVPVDWEDADDADRSGLRITLRLLEDEGRHFPDVTLDIDGGGAGDETIKETAVLTLVVNTWGQTAEALANKLRASIWSSQRYGFDALWKYVGLGSVSTITDLSALESAQIGARYEFRVKLHTTLDHNFGADYAETIGVVVNESRLGEVINDTFGTDPHPIPEDC